MEAQDTVLHRLHLQIASDQRAGTFDLMIADRALVGRASDSGPKPDLDLTDYGAAAHGVSRSHASFSYDAGSFFVEDLQSASGTRLNGLLLTPRRRYRLRDSDELEFGRIRVTIRL